jgi:Mrp family chromosome partitioning ATPase
VQPLEYVKLLQRRWYIPVLTLMLGAAAAWMTTPANPGPPISEYKATHTLFRDASVATSDYNLETLALLATTGDIPARVAGRLAEDVEPAVLAAEVTVSGDNKLGTLTVESSDRDGERAAALARGFAYEVVAYFDEQEAQAQESELRRSQQELEDMRDRLIQLEAQLATQPEQGGEGDILRSEKDALLRQYGLTHELVQETRAGGPGTVGLITLQEAVPIPVLAEGFQPPRSRASRVAIACVLGPLLGVGLILLLEQLDTRVRTRRGAERAFGLPVVAEIPKMPARQRRGDAIVTVTAPGSFAAEAYRILRLSLQLMPRWILPPPTLMSEEGNLIGQTKAAATPSPGPAGVVLVTSPGPDEGKTTTIANLAASFAEVGKRVLVLDCDLRHPQQHQYLGCEQGPGVIEYLSSRGGQRPMALRHFVQPTLLPGVLLVPGGIPVENPGRLLGPEQDLIHAAAEIADIVLIDAGPILAVNDPSVLIPRADAVVVVARSGQTTAESAHLTSELLARLEAQVLGVALVDVPNGSLARRFDAQSGRSAKRLLPSRDDPLAALTGERWDL